MQYIFWQKIFLSTGEASSNKLKIFWSYITYLRFFSVAYLIYFFKNLVLKYDFWEESETKIFFFSNTSHFFL